MQFSIRSIIRDDIPFLWEMIYVAGHMSEEGASSSDAARRDPNLNLYINDWGRCGDRGFIAYDTQSLGKLGAAWIRFLTEHRSYYGYYDDQTPALAIAVLPDAAGQGIGSALLSLLIEKVKQEVPAIVLTVRSNNPAKKLYDHAGFIVIGDVVNRVGTKSYKMLLKFHS